MRPIYAKNDRQLGHWACAACGDELPGHASRPAMHQHLTVCPNHPMRAVERQLTEARRLLEGLLAWWPEGSANDVPEIEEARAFLRKPAA